MKSNFLKAQWKNLVMVNYIIDPQLLRSYIPYKTEVDEYNGNVYVSLVGFLFANTRLLGLKIPFHINFEEVNLRFYVRYDDGVILKRGVVFIKEIVPRRAITLIANRIYRENYSNMPMKHFFNETSASLEFNYHWKYKNKWNSLEAVTEKTALSILNGSEVQFIAEHYWGYSKYSNRKTFEYEVRHVPWKVFPVKEYLIDCDFTVIYGENFSFLENQKPESVFVAEGSAITVLHKRTI